MQDSFTSALIPLSSDEAIRDKYVTFLGSVRLGRLMEDMDMFAVWVVHQHVKIPSLSAALPLPYTFVTLLVDCISFTDTVPKVGFSENSDTFLFCVVVGGAFISTLLRSIQNDSDIRLSGHVSWVGRSSVEVVVWLEQKIGGKWRKLTRALFLMAARNATNTSAAIVNPLHPANDEEQRIFDGGESELSFFTPPFPYIYTNRMAGFMNYFHVFPQFPASSPQEKAHPTAEGVSVRAGAERLRAKAHPRPVHENHGLQQ